MTKMARAPARIANEILRGAARRASLYVQQRSMQCYPCTLRQLHITATRRAVQGRKQLPRPSKNGRRSITARTAPLGLLAAGGVFASLFALSHPHSRNEDEHLIDASVDAAPTLTDLRDPCLPRYRVSDVRKHDATSPHPWVTFEDKVYDITDWVAAHPGGDVILRAAGGSIEPYWKIFTIHNAPHVQEILSQYLIGYIDGVDLVDGRLSTETIEDPFEKDPPRDERLITHTAKPRNAETPNVELDREFRTNNNLFYVRNHMWVPVVSEEESDKHALTVELPDGETKKYTLEDLRTQFKVHKVTAVLQCSGNRRSDMTRHVGETNGLQWGVGAIGNAEWEGVRLADVLADAGLKVALVPPDASTSNRDEAAPNPSTHHVQFTGLEAYGASIPLAKALDPRGDVILAFGMNGKPLPRDHGYPLRALVPGHVAARSVKWLSKIVVSDEESTSQWQRRDYKLFGPNVGANPNWDSAPAIQEMPITSAITGVWVGECIRRGKVPWMAQADGKNTSRVEEGVPSSGPAPNSANAKSIVGYTKVSGCPDQVRREPIALQGYAYSGGGRVISRVDVSLDGGKTWDQAELLSGPATGDDWKGSSCWAWKRWRYTGHLHALPLPKDGDANDPKHCTTVTVKAIDVTYNTQPESHDGIYNVRGNLATAWHRVQVCPKCTRNGDRVTWSTGQTFGCGFKKEAEEGRGVVAKDRRE